jgi:hypothetical protein
MRRREADSLLAGDSGVRPEDMTRLEVLAVRHAHGTRVRYMTGCKCVPCRAANSRYETERALARQNGDWNGLVFADRARAHLRILSRRGIGRRLISDACGVSDSMLHEIKKGRKRRIRARTERAILSITDELRGDKTLLDAGPVWAKIDLLLRHGFSRAEIARRIGMRMPKLQLNSEVVTARSAMRIEKLCATVFAGDPEVSAKMPRLRPMPQGSPR